MTSMIIKTFSTCKQTDFIIKYQKEQVHPKQLKKSTFFENGIRKKD